MDSKLAEILVALDNQNREFSKHYGNAFNEIEKKVQIKKCKYCGRKNKSHIELCESCGAPCE